MSHENVILVGLDGSDAALHALDWATQEARVRQWGLRLVCSYALPSFAAASLDGGYAALDDSAIRAGAEAVLAEALARVADSGVPVTSHVAVGDAAAVLVDESREVGLVVVGTRGGGGFAERLLGTVSSALPAHAKCPTVVVPLRRRGTQEPAGSPLPEVAPIRRVLVGVDGSPQSELALRCALREAHRWEATVVAVSAVPVNTVTGVLAWLPEPIDHRAVLSDVEESLGLVLKRVTEEMSGLKGARLVRDGTGAEVLSGLSDDADLLVVGSRGRGGFAGLLLGSTSQAVLHHAQCPVLVVSKGADAEEPAA